MLDDTLEVVVLTALMAAKEIIEFEVIRGQIKRVKRGEEENSNVKGPDAYLYC